MLERSLVLLGSLFLATSVLASPLASDPASFDGSVLIRTSDAHRLYVAVSSHGAANGAVDHLFRLWSDDDLPPTDLSAPNAHVEFAGSAVVVSLADRQTVVTIGLPQFDSPLAPRNWSSLRFSGWALNHQIGAHVEQQHLRSHGVVMYIDCDLDPYCEQPIWEDPYGADDCTAGGANASSCSISNPGGSCSVSCMPPSYACCKTGYAGVSCKCVR